MTTARIISTPADGHGLTDKITDPHYSALTGGDLEAKWRSNFGIEPGAEWSFGDQGVPGDYCQRKSTALYDGLCPKCAKNAGVPVPADVPEEAAAS